MQESQVQYSTPPAAIGYVDVIYALSNHLGIGAVQNAAGNFVAPTLDTIHVRCGRMLLATRATLI